MSRTARAGVLLVAAALLLAAPWVVVGVVDEEPTGGPPPSGPTATVSPTVTPSPSAPPPPPSTAPPPPTLSPCPPGPPRRLRVLTFNIHGGLGDGGYDLERVAREIEAWNADVVLLQEVDRYRERTALDDQVLSLSTRLGMYPSFGANVVRPAVRTEGPEQEYGTLTLSRHPIYDSENVRLPNRPGLERRGLLRTTIDVRGAPVDVYNTHLQHTSGAVRRDQVRAIKQVLRGRSLPAVLGGDFNAEPDSRALGLLTGWRLTDPWLAVGSDDGLTVPARVPRRRIDFVLHDDAFEAVAAEDLLSEVSDHRAVRVVLDLPSPPNCGESADAG